MLQLRTPWKRATRPGNRGRPPIRKERVSQLPSVQVMLSRSLPARVAVNVHPTQCRRAELSAGFPHPDDSCWYPFGYAFVASGSKVCAMVPSYATSDVQFSTVSTDKVQTFSLFPSPMKMSIFHPSLVPCRPSIEDNRLATDSSSQAFLHKELKITGVCVVVVRNS
jgi:hypothetical protein